MALPPIVLIAFCAVLCLAPLSLYLSWLATLNRRVKPTILSSRTDLLALACGLSGFLLVGGVVLVAISHSNARFALRGNWEQIRAAWGEEQSAWLLSLLLYLGLVAAWLAFLAFTRSRSLDVYCVDRWHLENTLEEILLDLGQTPTRQGRFWTVELGPLVEVRYFEPSCHAIVQFHGADLRLSDELERELRLRLRDHPEVDNLAAVWILWSGITTLLVMFGCLALVFYYLYLVRR